MNTTSTLCTISLYAVSVTHFQSSKQYLYEEQIDSGEQKGQLKMRIAHRERQN